MEDKKKIIEVRENEFVEFEFDHISRCVDLYFGDLEIRIPKPSMLWLCEEFLRQYGDKKEDVYKGKYEQLVFKYADLTQKFADFLMSGKKN